MPKHVVPLTIFVPHFCFVLMIVSAQPLPAAQMESCKFDQIYQLGDSISDTGNIIQENAGVSFGRPPYGQNFLQSTPTGRCSNGFLMIDYIAMASGLPLLPPIKSSNADFRHGANFAVAGATALSVEALAGRNIHPGMTQSSLDVQLDWMKAHFRSVFSSQTDCAEKLQNALFVVGEIGGNDYNAMIFNGNSLDAVKGSMVPQVVDAIINVVGEAVKMGARTVFVPGNFPTGCFPLYKTGFGPNLALDENQCIVQMNEFSMYHNDQLKQAIRRFKKEANPNATIIYGDYYKAYLSVLRSFKSLGLEYQSACCGAGGQYNYNGARMCGVPGVNACPNPQQHISWDGIHLTQEAYRRMSSYLLRRLSKKLHCRFST